MNKIVIDSGFSQSRVALLENGELVEYYIESKNFKRIVGNIYKGRVKNVLPGMQAAFVDIGLEKNAFLYVKDAIPQEILYDKKKTFKDILIKDVIKNGQEIIVQVTKEPMDNKGARVTTHLSFPGRYLVLMPNIDYIGISRRIEDKDERARLRKIVEEIRPKGMGLIIRTESENKEEKDLIEDLKYLLKLWHKIEKEKKLGFPPKILYKDLDLIYRTIRDFFTEDIEELIINDKENYNAILEFLDLISPKLQDRVKYFDPGINIFSYYGIEKKIKEALSRKVWLKSGGYIVIDKTEALTSIDVNSGKYVGVNDLSQTIIKVNKEAAKEIAKQIRLRDIGGIIIIDFIDMENKKYEQEILKLLESELSKDRVRTNVLGMTGLGLVEMTRKKVRKRISSILEKKCPYCNGLGMVLTPETVINNLENELKRISLHTNSEAVIVNVNKEVGRILNGDMKEYVERLENALNLKIFICKDDNIHSNDYDVKYMGRLNKVKDILKEIDSK
ncbi:Rne/Rng family ribonuclease [Paramaledivibacter caminithermalis]|jgi:ribonuclease G|uniref:Ribonuclease G n=1 Tax=Paramaledivibacter caminithermalis (strain DSM 15212 / CIP 107654 / DViRD3) TaxID=1121301 RepID=A0A1M6MG15_PARC5|nr:Rne/Rng family ribonuclease [Paramaledivibacter caminithermalis]SHJ82316.1 RNAse G [Paramaledivibacter caminithermalis DSM 15212]